MKTIYLFAFLFFALVETKAKPLSYVGTMLMQENDETGYTVSVDYTFDPHFALGVYAKRYRRERFLYHRTQLNTLIKRWNLPDGQGNIFSMTGAGVSRQGSNNQPAAWAAALATSWRKTLDICHCAGVVHSQGGGYEGRNEDV